MAHEQSTLGIVAVCINRCMVAMRDTELLPQLPACHGVVHRYRGHLVIIADEGPALLFQAVGSEDFLARRLDC